MSQFEFLMVLAGMVVAVAMTEIVGGLGRLIRSRGQVNLDWLHIMWSYNVLILAMLYWNGMWPYQTIKLNYVWQIWLLVLPTLSLVIVGYALSPHVSDSTNLVVREYYLQKRRPIFWGLATFVLMANFADFAIAGVLAAQDLLLTLTMAGLFVLLSFNANIKLHGTVVLLMAVFLTLVGFQEIDDSFSRFSQT